MPTGFLLLSLVICGLWYVAQVGRLKPQQARALTAKLGGGLLVALAIFLAFRGWQLLAATVLAAGLGLWGFQQYPDFLKKWQAGVAGKKTKMPPAAQALRMEANLISNSLDDGVVLQGKWAGHRLSSLSFADLVEVRGELLALQKRGDQSVALLDAWGQHYRPAWWKEIMFPHRNSPPKAALSQADALAILGLKNGATAGEIRAAYRRLIKAHHPDTGGSDYLAMQINQAKDRLLQD